MKFFQTKISRRTACAASLLIAFGAMPARLPAQSLYTESTYRPLVADNKAYRVGDLLTVQVFENSSASTSADTSTHRNNGLTAQLGHGASTVAQTNAVVNGDFAGGGQTQRANRLLTTLTVTVREVLPNQDLRIAGEQMVTINEEPQKVSLEGVVRPIDITDGNVVLSTRIADARIVYVGEGDLAQRNRRSWWRKFVDAIGF